MKSLCKWLDVLLSYAMILLVSSLVVCVCWQVLVRYLLQAPSAYTEEIARFLLIWLGLLGSAYAYRKGAHLGLDLLVNQLPHQLRRWVAGLTHGLVLLFAVLVMIAGGIQLMQLALDPGQVSASMQLNMAIIYAVLPLSGTWMSIYALAAMLGIEDSQQERG